MNQVTKKHMEAITYYGWDNGTLVSFYKPGVEGDEGELKAAASASAMITKKVAIDFFMFVTNNSLVDSNNNKLSIREMYKHYLNTIK